MTRASIDSLIQGGGKKSALPSAVSPMLCTLVKEPFNDPDYLYEVKWDGYRIVSFVNKGTVQMNSRGGLNYTQKYPPVANALKALKFNVVLDGEVIVLNDAGRPDFDALQKFNGHDSPLYYYVFDILWLDGYDLMELPLSARKQLLAALFAKNEIIRYSEHFDDGMALFAQMEALQMEGIVAKRRTSIYRPGERANNWLKIPTEKRQEFVIGGWVESDRGRPFASLLFGAYNNKALEWIGHGGGGFKEAEMPFILKKLKALEVPENPFVNEVDTKGKIHWAKPKLVANFKFATWTKSGKIRKPAIFLGFRNDKPASSVVRESPVNNVAEKQKPSALKTSRGKPSVMPSPIDSNWPSIEKQKITSSEQFDIGGCTIELNNVEKQLWKEVTKYDLIQYYHSMTNLILPYIKNRPQSLHIKQVNAIAPGFYIKDMEGHQPECADIFTDERKHKMKGKRDQIDYLVCNNEASLLYMINLGCIDVNPWTSRIQNPAEPDYIVIDLDPSDADFKKVIETAGAAKSFFDAHKLAAFIKTSGKTGMHILLPCKGIAFTYARTVAEYICGEIHRLVPSVTTTEVSVDSRGKKLYIDPNQNDYADTIAAPYSVRPHTIPCVSTPLEWKEVRATLDPQQFTINNMTERVKKKGDLWQDIQNNKSLLQVQMKNAKILKRLLE
ncbi:MAG: ligase [Ferruginibacter sp.]|uniref:DNA ligase D n=1 Tax=Ferruginibacter sp. TaxID=1940288 RepID=UPI002658DFEB|nr:DNA ligase D [Ferruginibacter sp.]MDB5276131.1 ligase [Ferruginibacter sp.]